MAIGDMPNELLQCREQVSQRLMGAGLREEHDEIDGVAGVQGHADLGFALEPAHAGAMPSAGVEDDHRWLGGIDAIVPAVLADLGDAQQRVVHGARELACVEQRLVLEIEQRRQAGALVVEHVVGTPAQGVEEQDRPLQHIALIGK